MLLKFLAGLLRPRRKTIADTARQPYLPQAIDEEEFSRAWRDDPYSVTPLIAHARWQMSRAPLRAAALLREAARRQTQGSLPLRLLGELHLGLGNHQSAAESFQLALLRDETDSAAWHGLAQARHAQKKSAAARFAASQSERLAGGRRSASADFAPVLQPALPIQGDWQAWREFLETAQESDDLLFAETQLERHAAARAASSGRIALSIWLTRHAKPRAGYRLAQEAVAEDASSISAIYALALAHGALGQVEAARQLCRAALVRNPRDADLHTLLADCLGMMGDNLEAVEEYRQAIAACARPDAMLLNNYGCSLTLLERFAEAVPPLRTALALSPGLQKARLNLAYALTYLGELDEARALLDALLAEEPGHFDAHWYRSHLLLATRAFASGWREYRYRFVSAAQVLRVIPSPLWQGEPLTGRSLLVTAEQGIGDAIMFASCLPDLQARATAIKLECDPRLHSLFARSFPGIELVPAPTNSTDLPVAADCHIPLGDLPALFRPNIVAFQAARTPFLVPDPQAVARIRSSLDRFGPGLKVGLAWRGGAVPTRQHSRSIPLADLTSLLAVKNCHFVSLQYGDCADEIADCEMARARLTHFPELIADLDALAALTASLDLIITVCSATAHFAGAVGSPAWVMAPHAPEWRYYPLNTRMLWYPSVRIFRQTTPGDWGLLLSHIEARLAWRANKSRQGNK